MVAIEGDNGARERAVLDGESHGALDAEAVGGAPQYVRVGAAWRAWARLAGSELERESSKSLCAGRAGGRQLAI